MEAAFRSSLKVAVTFAFTKTLLAPATGVVEVTPAAYCPRWTYSYRRRPPLRSRRGVETSLVEGALKNAVRRAKADPHGTARRRQAAARRIRRDEGAVDVQLEALPS